MGWSPCFDESGRNKGLWTLEEDEILFNYIKKNGRNVSWRALSKIAGLNRTGKSCRLRWTNYLRPDIKRGNITSEEEKRILNLHAKLGNKWSIIAKRLPGRTDNEIKNYWNTHLKKKLTKMGFDPMTHRPQTDSSASLFHLLALANNLIECLDQALRLHSEARAELQYLQTFLQITQPNYDDSSVLTTGNNSSANKFNSFTDIETLKLLMTSLAQSGSSIPSSIHDFPFAELQRNGCNFETSYLNNNPDTTTSDHVVAPVLPQEDNSGVDFMWQLPPLYPTGAVVTNLSMEVPSNSMEDWPHFNDLDLSGTGGDGLMS